MIPPLSLVTVPLPDTVTVSCGLLGGGGVVLVVNVAVQFFATLIVTVAGLPVPVLLQSPPQLVKVVSVAREFAVNVTEVPTA